MRSLFLSVFERVKESTPVWLGIVLGIGLSSCAPEIRYSNPLSRIIGFSDLSLTSLSATDTTVGLTGSFSATIQNNSSVDIDLSSVVFSSSGTVNGIEFSITGGTCVTPGVILGNASCTVSGTFTPFSASTRSESLTISYTISGSAKSESATLIGLGLSPGSLSMSGVSFTSMTVGVSSSAVTTTVTNTGQTAATLNTRTLRSTGSVSGTDYEITGGTCADSGVIAASATCTMQLVFTPTTTGVLTDTIDLDYDDGVATQISSLAITGTGLGLSPASLSITSHTSPYSYGAVSVASTVTESFTLTNGGGSDATNILLSGLSGVYADAGTGTCGGTLASGGTCTIDLSFTPVDLSTSTQTLDITYDDDSGNTGLTTSFDLTGSGVSAPALDYSCYGSFALDEYWDFVGGSNPLTPCTFSAGPGATLSSCAIKGGTPALPSGMSVNNADCAIGGLAFPGTPSNTYTVLATNSFGETVEADITFSVTPIPTITSFDKSLVAEGSTLVITGLDFTDVNAINFNGTTALTFTVDSDTQITMIVPVGATTGTIEIFNSFGKSVTSSTSITVGLPAVLSLVESAYLGSVIRGTNADYDLNLKNGGDLSAETMAVGTDLSGAFSWASGGAYPGTNAVGKCDTTLVGSNTTCALQINFAPTQLGPHGSPLTITYFDGVQNQTLTLQPQGKSDTLFLSHREWDFGEVREDGAAYVTFRVINRGKTAVSFTPSFSGDSQFNYGGGSFPGSGGVGYSPDTPACGASLAGESSCDMILAYTPGGANLTHTGTFSIAAASGDSLSATLSGTSITAPSCSCNPADSVTFGNALSDGTVGLPFQICSRAHLERIDSGFVANTGWSGKNFLQCADIDLGGSGTPFAPIGNYNVTNELFQGTYDGNHYLIENLYYHNAARDYVGLFSATGIGTLKNISLKNVDLIGKNYVASIAGRNQSGHLEYIQSQGEVTGIGAVAGLFGDVFSIKLIRSYFTGTLNGSSYTGGLISYNQSSGTSIYRSFALVNINQPGSECIAGILGYDTNSTSIVASHAHGSLTSIRSGGILGCGNSYISHSYSTTNISGSQYDSGGIATQFQGKIISSAAYGKITGTTGGSVGGLVGSIEDPGLIRTSFFDGSIEGGAGMSGGIYGFGRPVAVTDSYSSGVITLDSGSANAFGASYAGTPSISISNSYAAAPILSSAGGGSDFNSSGGTETYSNNFFWATGAVNGVAPVLFNDNNGSAGALTATEMQTQSTFTTAGWDFVKTWQMSGTGSGFPALRQLGPGIAYFTPTTANVGRTVTLIGLNFTGATSVKFNGVDAASFTVVNANKITAVVPSGATDGVITVITPDGEVESNESWYMPADTTPPATPTYLYSYPSSGGTQSSPQLCFDPGSIEGGATFYLYANDNTCGSTPVNSSSPDGSGCLAADLSGAEGAYDVYVQLTDADYNASTCTLVKNYSWHNPPTALSYSSASSTYPLNSAITPNPPTFTGTATLFSVFPPLPAGLVIDPSTGIISGTPTRPITDGEFTITASNGSSSTTATITITVPAASCDRLAAPFGGGAGTSGNPYLLCSRAQLAAMEDTEDLYFKLASDIDLGATNPWTTVKFKDSANFMFLDGDGFDIIHMRSNNCRSVYAGGFCISGLFLGLNEFTVSNLTVRDFEVALGGGATGGGAAIGYNGRLTDVEIKRGSVTCPAPDYNGTPYYCAGAVIYSYSLTDVNVSEVEITGGDYTGGVAYFPFPYGGSTPPTNLSFSGKIASSGYGVGGVFSQVSETNTLTGISLNAIINILDSPFPFTTSVGGLVGIVYQAFPSTFSITNSTLTSYFSGVTDYLGAVIGGYDLFSDSTPACPPNTVSLDASNGATIYMLGGLSTNLYEMYGGFCPPNIVFTNNVVTQTQSKNCILDAVNSIRRAADGSVSLSIEGKGLYTGATACYTPTGSGTPYCSTPLTVNTFATTAEAALGLVPEEGAGKITIDCDTAEINVTLE